MGERVGAEYEFRTGLDPERAALTIAGETEALTERAGAGVEALAPLEDTGARRRCPARRSTGRSAAGG